MTEGKQRGVTPLSVAGLVLTVLGVPLVAIGALLPGGFVSLLGGVLAYIDRRRRGGAASTSLATWTIGLAALVVVAMIVLLLLGYSGEGFD